MIYTKEILLHLLCTLFWGLGSLHRDTLVLFSRSLTWVWIQVVRIILVSVFVKQLV